jgi:hypothetical protein
MAGTQARTSSDEFFLEPEILRLNGEVALRRDRTSGAADAENWFKKALMQSQLQEAKSLELRAALSLARLWCDRHRQTEAHDLLAPIYDWFTEGYNLSDLTEAKALLSQLTIVSIAAPGGLRSSPTRHRIASQVPSPSTIRRHASGIHLRCVLDRKMPGGFASAWVPTRSHNCGPTGACAVSPIGERSSKSRRSAQFSPRGAQDLL